MPCSVELLTLGKNQDGSNVEPIVFELEFLNCITHNFSQELTLGSDGYGVDYKGVLRNGKIIAVKDLSEKQLDDRAFDNTIDYLTGIKHQNVVEFVGYSTGYCWHLIHQPSGSRMWDEIPKKLICFEYGCNGSLDKYIYDNHDIDWYTCFKIIKGICQGLCFLHNRDIPIIHTNLSPRNILLDADMVPKIANFSLSKFFGEERTELWVKKVLGSYGYMAPEYLERGEISTQSDIYSLGILIIEITTAECNCSEKKQPSTREFIHKVREDWTTEHILSKYQPLASEQIKACINIGLKCVEINQSCRPSIVEIVDMLNE